MASDDLDVAQLVATGNGGKLSRGNARVKDGKRREGEQEEHQDLIGKFSILRQ
jgi:hypothetical protein